ncbi:MAG: nucleoside monophosphate kinase [Firmicutes bacterium]|nr:nucleoside monophosphate kinase [Bacillota bacterium]
MEIHVDHHMYFAASRRPEALIAKLGETAAPVRGDSISTGVNTSEPGLIPNMNIAAQTAAISDKKETIPVRNMFLTLTGSPGSGKSTQGKALAERYGIPHISIGKILRKEITDGTTLGHLVEPYVKSGDLAPSHLIAAVVKNRLSQPDCKNGFILDGYPRKMDDTGCMEQITKDLGINNLKMVCIKADPEVIIDRLKDRRVCDNGHEYDLKNNPPKKEGVCDTDGLPIKQRDDDKPETIRHRFEVFKEETLPVMEYFKSKNQYGEVNGNAGIDVVGKRLFELLDPKEANGEQ